MEPAQHAELLGHLERAVVGQHHAAAAHADPGGGRRDGLDQHLGRRAGQRGRAVMLGHPVAVIAELVGQPAEVDAVAQGVGGGRALRDRSLVEDAQAQSGISDGAPPARGMAAAAPCRGLQRRVGPALIVGVDVPARRDDLVDAVEHVVRQLDVGRGQLRLEVLHRARADDGRGHGGMADHEGQRHLDQRDAGLVGQAAEGVGRVELGLVLGQRQVVAVGDHLGAARAEVVGALAPLAGQPAAGERAPRDHAHAVAPAHRQQLGLHTAVQQRVRRLLAHEALAPPLLGHPLRLHHLAGREGRAADVADLARAHEVGERAEGLVDVGVDLRAMDLVEVDPVRAEPAQAVVHLAHDPAARVAELVGVVAHLAVELGGQHDVVAAASLQRLPDDLLRLAARIDVGGVDEVDPGVERAVDDADGLVVVGLAPGAEHHRPEAQRADLDSSAAQRTVLHGRRD